MASAPLTSVLNGLYRSKDEETLLNLIDNLRTQKLGQLISIPQLVIIGDQSSGKSTTLESGTGIPFPASDGLCTVFATELRLRRSDDGEITIKIIPAPHRSDAEKQQIEIFGGSREAFTREDIGKWINEAKEVMGISESNPISDDVLQINVSGPDYPLLTIVDLPGLIHAGKGKESIQAMVNTYMAEPRSVILAVISGKNDIENQKVLDLVKFYDPEGRRTLGIITKPDIPKEGTKSEKDLIALAMNEHPEFRFRLGWHCLRGRSEQEVGSSEEERDEVERKFFATGPWKSIPTSCVGKGNFKPRLNQVLMNQIRAEFPALVAEVDGKFQEHKTMLERLGDSRATLEEQRTFLIGLSTRFQHLVNEAISGLYGHSFFGNSLTDEGYQRRLRAVIQNLNIAFREDMALKGHSRQIVEGPAMGDSNKGLPPSISRADFCQEVTNSLKRSRGCELPGMFNPLMVRDLFVNQASPWKGLATGHIEVTLAAVNRFLVDAIRNLTSIAMADPIAKDSGKKSNMESIIICEIITPFIVSRAVAMKSKLDNDLRAYRERNPLTYNHYFTENVQNMRKKRLQDRVMKELASYMNIDKSKLVGNLNINPLRFIESFSIENDADMDKFASAEIVDYMEAYYKVAQKRMVDNVADQIIEQELVEHLPDLFSAPSIQKMSPHLISKIAAESVADQYKRQELKRVLAILEKSLETCRAFQAGAPMKTIQLLKMKGEEKSNDGSGSDTSGNLTPASQMESVAEKERLEVMSETTGSFDVGTDSDEIYD